MVNIYLVSEGNRLLNCSSLAIIAGKCNVCGSSIELLLLSSLLSLVTINHTPNYVILNCKFYTFEFRHAVTNSSKNFSLPFTFLMIFREKKQVKGIV